MALKSIRIENFKSIGEIEIVNPQPFSVLVGPNAVGKSNIFAALQFLHHLSSTKFTEVIRGFGGESTVRHLSRKENKTLLGIATEAIGVKAKIDYSKPSIYWEQADPVTGGTVVSHREEPNTVSIYDIPIASTNYSLDYRQFIEGFSRIFVGNQKIVFIPFNDDSKLSFDARNLELVLKRVLNDPEIKDEFLETLQFFIPGLDRVEVISSEFSSNLDILVYEKSLNRPINKELISDGTYNIIAILTALYQSKTPQFLCIEEPENGLNPYVVKELVAICRYLCAEYGHYIWLNTHSQSLVSQLKPEEIILVDKKDGFTKVKQFEKGSFGDMPMDEAWLTNTLGGGLPW